MTSCSSCFGLLAGATCGAHASCQSSSVTALQTDVQWNVVTTLGCCWAGCSSSTCYRTMQLRLGRRRLPVCHQNAFPCSHSAAGAAAAGFPWCNSLAVCRASMVRPRSCRPSRVQYSPWEHSYELAASQTHIMALLALNAAHQKPMLDCVVPRACAECTAILTLPSRAIGAALRCQMTMQCTSFHAACWHWDVWTDGRTPTRQLEQPLLHLGQHASSMTPVQLDPNADEAVAVSACGHLSQMLPRVGLQLWQRLPCLPRARANVHHAVSY